MCTLLTLSILGKILSRRHAEVFFLIFPRKQDVTFHANCLQTICTKCQILFSGKIRINVNLSSADFAQRVLSVNYDPLLLTGVIMYIVFTQ